MCLYWCAISSNGRSSGGLERRWASFSVYRCVIEGNGRCAVWLVSMLAYVLVYVLRLVDSVPLLCTFLEVSMCVAVSALCLKPGSATVLELSFFSCWKFCVTILGCVDVLIIECLLGVVLPGVNVHVFTFFSLPCMYLYVISSFPCRHCFPRKSGVFWIRWSFMCPCECSQSIYVCTSCPLNA